MASIQTATLVIPQASAQGYSSIFEPAALTGAAIQDALNAAVAAGGGVVWLGGKTYTLTSTLTIDTSASALLGAGALLSATSLSSGCALKITMPTKSDNIFRASGGFAVAGPGASSSVDGVRFDQLPGSNDKNSQYTLRDVLVTGFNNGVVFSNGAYLVRMRDCAVTGCTNGAYTEYLSTNMGENISWVGGYIAGNSLAVLNSNQAEMFFTNVSFDYNTRVYDGWGTAEFHGCHFEQSRQSGSTNYPFKTDNGRIVVIGGSFTWAGSAPATKPNYFFNILNSGAVCIERSLFFQVDGAVAVAGPSGTYIDNHL